MHRLLERQLKRLFGKNFELSDSQEELKQMLALVSETYEDYEKDRRFLERTITVNTNELNDANTKIKLKNDELNNLVKLFREAQKIAKLGVWDLDFSTNSLHWSDEIYHIFELDDVHFIPSYEAFLDVIHPDDREAVSNAYQNSLITREQYKIVHRLLMKDGRIKWVEEQCETEFDDAGKPLRSLGTVYDISDQKSLENIIETEKQKFETILKTTKDGIVILDWESRFLYANNAYLEMSGYSEAELYTMNCHDISAPEDRPRDEAALEMLKEEGAVDSFEKRCLTKSGDYIYVSTSFSIMPDYNSILVSVRDITESKKREKELIDYVYLIDHNIIASNTDLSGKITYASTAFCEISGFSKTELLGQNHRMIRHPDMPDSLYTDMWDTLLKNKVWKGEIKNKKKNGEIYWVEATISPVFDNVGKKIGYNAIRQDITDKKLIEKISVTDGLTGIFNRRHFNEMLPKVINSAKRNNSLVTFMIMDVDHFKQYNDTYGHHMGDDALKKIATVLQSSLQRADDYCFRLGGEEFGILCDSETIEGAISFANQICKKIESLHIMHEHNSASPYVTVSIGLLCMHAETLTDADDVYKQADDLLYKAKASGKNKVCVGEE